MITLGVNAKLTDMTSNRYSDMYTNPIKASKLEHRDVVLDILSDARVVGPLMQTGLFHAEVNRRNYMYVFGHNSFGGPHASRRPKLRSSIFSSLSQVILPSTCLVGVPGIICPSDYLIADEL
uniref:Uncharacterized protein n=1 Tax=Glossina austeni TaxID=7395 RepID=A0A1A9VW83_GLOAU